MRLNWKFSSYRIMFYSRFGFDRFYYIWNYWTIWKQIWIECFFHVLSFSMWFFFMLIIWSPLELQPTINQNYHCNNKMLTRRENTSCCSILFLILSYKTVLHETMKLHLSLKARHSHTLIRTSWPVFFEWLWRRLYFR